MNSLVIDYDKPEYKRLYEVYLEKFKLRQNKGSHGKKDSERQKTYAAESIYRKAMNIKCTYHDVRLDSGAYRNSAYEFHNKIVNSKTWANHTKYPSIKPRATFSSRLRGANANRYRVLYGGLRDKTTIIHELAHSIGNHHHGRSFRQSQVMLTGRFLGSEHKKALMKAYKNAGLSYGKERKPKTFEKYINNYIHMTTTLNHHNKKG
jgi:hypothetical protein